MSNLLILFAKAPEAGKVKTRLTPFLSEIEAARLQKAFILDLLQITKMDSVERAIACMPTPKHPFFQQCKSEHPIRLIQQEGKDLGERMKNAFHWGFTHGFKHVVIIGCDAPTLPQDAIREAFDLLSSNDLVLGPGLDGGYYLIGARTLVPDLFIDLPWGSDTVLIRTLEILSRDHISSHLLPFWYDIDRPQDLIFLKTHLKYLSTQKHFTPTATSALIAQLSQTDTPRK